MFDIKNHKTLTRQLTYDYPEYDRMNDYDYYKHYDKYEHHKKLIQAFTKAQMRQSQYTPPKNVLQYSNIHEAIPSNIMDEYKNVNHLITMVNKNKKCYVTTRIGDIDELRWRFIRREGELFFLKAHPMLVRGIPEPLTSEMYNQPEINDLIPYIDKLLPRNECQLTLIFNNNLTIELYDHTAGRDTRFEYYIDTNVTKQSYYTKVGFIRRFNFNINIKTGFVAFNNIYMPYIVASPEDEYSPSLDKVQWTHVFNDAEIKYMRAAPIDMNSAFSNMVTNQFGMDPQNLTLDDILMLELSFPASE